MHLLEFEAELSVFQGCVSVASPGVGGERGEEGTLRLLRTGVTMHCLKRIWGMTRPLRRGGGALRRLSRGNGGAVPLPETQGNGLVRRAISRGRMRMAPFPGDRQCALPQRQRRRAHALSRTVWDGAPSSSGPNRAQGRGVLVIDDGRARGGGNGADSTGAG